MAIAFVADPEEHLIKLVRRPARAMAVSKILDKSIFARQLGCYDKPAAARGNGGLMKRQRVGPSLVEDVQTELREKILQGGLAPGERLLVQPLSQRLQVSLSVVREALSRLAEQGLVRSAPQHGFTVTPLSLDDLADLTRVRIDIENLIVRRAIAEGDLAWEASVLASHHHLAGTAPQLGGHLNPAWRSAHSEFHAAVASGCQSPLLQTLRLGLFDKAELYRAWAVRAGEPRDVAQEHRAICKAVLDRDADRAAGLMAAHIQLTADLVVTTEAGVSQERGTG